MGKDVTPNVINLMMNQIYDKNEIGLTNNLKINLLEQGMLKPKSVGKGVIVINK